jgi:hypothetical protein
MSSEMRELIRKAEALAACVMAVDSYSRDELRVFAENFRDEARALLARTEVRADGAGVPFCPNCGSCDVVTHPQDASADTRRMDWLEKNVTETLTARSIQGEYPYPEHKTKFVLPNLISWADFCGQIGFREAIDYAIENAALPSPPKGDAS